MLTVRANAYDVLQLRDLRVAIDKLPVEQRQAILLVGLEGLNYEQAAAVLKVPIGTIRSRLSRGRDQLRKLMGMDEDAEPGPPSWLRSSLPLPINRANRETSCRPRRARMGSE